MLPEGCKAQLPVVTLTTFHLVAPLLKAPPPLSAHVLICERVGERNTTTSVQTLLVLIRVCLKATAPVVITLVDLDIEDHLTGRGNRLWIEMVPDNPLPPSQAPTYIMQMTHPSAPQSTPPKKDTTP